MNRNRCLVSGESFDIPALGAEICERLAVPLPQLSFREATRQRLGYRNIINLYKRKCDKSGRSLISNFPPDSPFTVYDKDIWFGDSWDALAYGRPFDFSQPFFPQFYELLKVVPIFNLQNVRSENSDYCNSIEGGTNCYLSAVVYGGSRDIFYSYWAATSSDIYFSVFVNRSELCFYCFCVRNCYECLWCEECSNCSNCSFGFLLESCHDCLFCSNLKNKQYHIFNRPYTKEAYLKECEALKLGSYLSLQKHRARFEQLKREAFYREALMISCEDCTGNHLNECKGCIRCFEGSCGEDSAECISFGASSNDMFRSYGYGAGTELCYEICGCNGTKHSAFVMLSYCCFDCQYCINMHHCNHCFGCAGLRNKEYCIFNKQYSEKEYKALRAQLIQHMQKTLYEDPSFSESVPEYGQFFPLKYSFYPYNMTLAQTYYPLERETALERGYLWQVESCETEVNCERNHEWPDDIAEWNEDLAQSSLLCEVTSKPFTISAYAIRKLKERILAPLRIHPLQLMKERMKNSTFELVERTSAVRGVLLYSEYTEDIAPKILTNDEYRKMFY